jgi:putative copper export protein
MVFADLLAFALRAFAFVGLFLAAGTAFFLSMFRDIPARASAPPRRLGMIAAAAAAVCFVAQQSLEAARFAGELSGITQRDLLLLAWSSASGLGQAVRVAGLVLIVVGLARKAVGGLAVASIGAALALLSFLLSGHTSIHPLRPVLAPLLAIHVIIVAFWFGSLLPLWLISRQEPSDRAASVLRKFSLIAGASVPLIFVAGLAMFLILAGDLSVLQRAYGQLVVAKIAAFVLLMLLASCNRWRLVPAMASGGRSAAARLRRSILAEIVLIATVLTITAGLTLFLSPED